MIPHSLLSPKQPPTPECTSGEERRPRYLQDRSSVQKGTARWCVDARRRRREPMRLELGKLELVWVDLVRHQRRGGALEQRVEGYG